MRTDSGFYSTAQNGAITWEQVGWQKFHDMPDNQLADGRLTVGFDSRLQMARLGAPHWSDDGELVTPDRLVIPMQMAPALSVKITDWLSATGSYNVSTLQHSYLGQSPYDAWLQIKTSQEMPSLRVGMIQPTIGMRHDDHTMLLRRNPLNPGLPMIAPNWNELGAEVTYEGQHWISAEAGVFMANNLALSDSGAVKKGDLITSARLTLWPQLEDYGLNSWIGGSFLKAGDLTLVGSHIGLGKPYWGALQAEMVMTQTAANRDMLSWMIHASHPLKEWFVLEARYEKSTGSTSVANSNAEMTSLVAGVQFIPLPNVELRPEYRVLTTKDWKLAQWALQLHLWF